MRADGGLALKCTSLDVEVGVGMTLHPRIRPAGLLMGALSACLTGIALSFALLVIGAAPARAPLNPETHQKCTIEEFQTTPPTCPAGTEVGIDEATVVLGKLDVPAKGKVFNLEPEPGEHPEGLHLEPMPLLFGILIEVEGVPTPERSYLEGHVSWAREKRA